MNNITKGQSSPLQIEEIKKRVTLNRLWGRIWLFGNHWHLYRNDTGGAGIIDQGRRVEFQAGRWYLVPPYRKLETWCTHEHPVYQFFIHFNTIAFLDWGGESWIELPVNPELDGTYHRLKTANISSNLFPLLLLKLVTTACCMLPESPNYEGQFSPKISTLLFYIASHLSDQFGLEQMAQIVNVSKNTLLRHFKEEIGVSPYQYLSNLRYTKAANLLTQSNLSLEEICEAIGVLDRFHFSRMFKRIYGQSPGMYRKAQRDATNPRFAENP